MRQSFFFLSAFAALLFAPAGFAALSDLSKEDEAYNAGTKLLKKLEFVAAEKKLQEALKIKEAFPEAHNNLAFALRKQGEEKFPSALQHYHRAIELNPKLSEAYMYRGVLYIQMGKPDLAKADHATLSGLSTELAAELEWVIENGKEKEPEQFFGVTALKK
ncbi:MAG: tetratricopeptide repeat protein [Verrucomicrobiota bacterium]